MDKVTIKRSTVEATIARLALEKQVLTERVEELEKETVDENRTLKDTLNDKEKELGDLEKKWANALKEVERLEQKNRELTGQLHVSNIVTEFLPGRRKIRTTVCWGLGESTTVNLASGDQIDPYNAFCAALAKRIFGSTNQVRKIIERMQTTVLVDENGKAVLSSLSGEEG